MIKIAGVQRHEIHDAWPQIKDYFRSFEDRADGEMTAGDLLLDVMTGQRQVWVAVEDGKIKACALTEVLSNPKKTVVINFCAGEDHKTWAKLMVDEIKDWGLKHQGSKRMRAVHRPGWSRILREMGFRETHRASEIELGQDT